MTFSYPVTPDAKPPEGSQPSSHRLSRSRGYDRVPGSGWTGLLGFAAVLMMFLGVLQLLEGFTGINRRGYYLTGSNHLPATVGYTGWGIAHIGLGVLVFCAGVGVLAGWLWARVVGVAVAAVSALVNMAFVPAYPWWSVLVVALDVLVIYALVTHGSQMSSQDSS